MSASAVGCRWIISTCHTSATMTQIAPTRKDLITAVVCWDIQGMGSLAKVLLEIVFVSALSSCQDWPARSASPQV